LVFKPVVRKRNPQVNAVVTPTIMEQLLRRAAGLGATKSEYASLVIRFWVAQGCPPVNEREQLLLASAPSPIPPASGSAAVGK
jgi:hypothetical protein